MNSQYTIVLSDTPAVDAWGERPDRRLWDDWRWLDCSPETYAAIEYFQTLPVTVVDAERHIVVVSSHPYLRKGDVLRLAQA
jgi:hypothetical protein